MKNILKTIVFAVALFLGMSVAYGATTVSIPFSGGNYGFGTSTPDAFVQITNTGSNNSFVVEDASPDSSRFVIDASGNVGIGTTTPQGGYKFQVISGSAANFSVGNSTGFKVNTTGGLNGNTKFNHSQISGAGAVGFEIESTPTGTPTYNRSLTVTASSTGANISIIPIAVNGSNNVAMLSTAGQGTYGFGMRNLVTYPSMQVEIATTTSGGYFGISSTSSSPGNVFTVASNGWIGVGTSTPSATLHVVGDIRGSYVSSDGTAGFTGSGTCTITEIKDGIITGASC